MYQKIMVPLDGSELAECVLPHVEALARGCQVKNVILVRVVESFCAPYSDEGYILSDEELTRINSETRTAAENYLDQLVSRIKYDEVNLQTEVILGEVVESLDEYVQKNGVDLIVIATHGRSGITRWVWGSVAERILRSSCVPVLMVRAPGCIPGI
jgi:nucleotide-binding universal stress UspA family protein